MKWLPQRVRNLHLPPNLDKIIKKKEILRIYTMDKKEYLDNGLFSVPEFIIKKSTLEKFIQFVIKNRPLLEEIPLNSIQKILNIRQITLVMKMAEHNGYFILKKYEWNGDEGANDKKDVIISISGKLYENFLHLKGPGVFFPREEAAIQAHHMEAELLWTPEATQIAVYPLTFSKKYFGALSFIPEESEFSPPELALLDNFSTLLMPVIASNYYAEMLRNNAEITREYHLQNQKLTEKLQNLEKKYLRLIINYTELKKELQNYKDAESYESNDYLELFQYDPEILNPPPEGNQNLDDLSYLEDKIKTNPSLRAILAEIEDIIWEEKLATSEEETVKNSGDIIICFWNSEVVPKRKVLEFYKNFNFNILCMQPKISAYEESRQYLRPRALFVSDTLEKNEKIEFLSALRRRERELPIICEEGGNQQPSYTIYWREYQTEPIGEERFLRWLNLHRELFDPAQKRQKLLALSENFSLGEFKPILKLCCGKYFYVSIEPNLGRGISLLYRDRPKVLIAKIDSDPLPWLPLFSEIANSPLLQEIPLIVFSQSRLPDDLRERTRHLNSIQFFKSK